MAKEFIMSNVDFDIKIIEIQNKFYFEGVSMARNIGYANGTLALRRHVWDEYKTTIRGYSYHGESKIMLTEAGLYQLIMNANTPKARAFQKWVFEEVLPSIRQNGGYISGQEKLAEDEKKQLLAQIRKLADDNKMLIGENKQLRKDLDIREKAFDKLSERVIDIANDIVHSSMENKIFNK